MTTIAEATIEPSAASEPRLPWVRPRVEIADIKEITCNGAGSGNDTGINTMMSSDVRLKKNITRLGVSPSGLPIYSFQYIWGGPTVVGVMAQDLLALRPDAVRQNRFGFYAVDYDKIDVELPRIAA